MQQSLTLTVLNSLSRVQLPSFLHAAQVLASTLMLHFAEAAKDATVPSSSSISEVAGVAHVNIEARGPAVCLSRQYACHVQRLVT